MAGALAALVRAKLGMSANALINRATAAVGVAAQQLLRNDPDRVAALIVNLSLNRIYVGPFPDVSATKGIRLDPGGATLALLWEEDLDVTGWEWFAVADAAASSVLVVEYVGT